MRTLKIAVAGLAAAIVVCVVLLLAFGLPSGFATSAIQARVERDTGYRVAIGGPVRIGLWPAFSLTLHDIALEAPQDRAMTARVNIDAVRVQAPLWGLLSGDPAITELAITKPVLRLPLLRERMQPANAAAPKGYSPQPTAVGDNATPITLDHLTITDGTVVLSNPRDHVEDHIEAINAEVSIGADRQITASGSAQSGDNPLTFALKSTMPDASSARKSAPVELTLDAPTWLRQTLTSTADVRVAGSTLMVNGLSGSLGGKPFNGWASVDLADKPLVKVDLDFQDLAIGEQFDRNSSGTTTEPTTTPTQPWSDTPLALDRLNYIDANIRVSAARMAIGDVRLAPVALEASLARGVLHANVQNLGLYDGHADGNLTIDVSGKSPAYALRADIDGVRALPVLSGLADFTRIDGKLQTRLAVQSTGASQRAIIAGLNGTAVVSFQDGTIRGLNVARMIRSLTSGTLSGWQTGSERTTDFTQLKASFQIAEGKAATSDLALAGPLIRVTGAGTVDLPSKALALRVEPKLVMTTEGQGGNAAPIGLGILVMIEGPWAEPRIYPDTAGILDDPQAAYARLRELGQGLFGSDPANPSKGSLGDTLGDMIQQGLGGVSKPATPGQGQDGAPSRNSPSPIDGILKQLFGRQ
jgi:AsmA protein